MIDKKESLKWGISILFAISIILIILTVAFQDDAIYRKGYEENGAYEKLNQSMVWKVTENTQKYFRGQEELNYFSPEEREHLEEVKIKIQLGRIIGIILLITAITTLIIQHRKWRKHKKITKKEYNDLNKYTGIALLGISTILIIMGVFWEWFFTAIHNLLFTGQWIFDNNLLMIELWGGNFFQSVAKIIILRIVRIGIIVWAIGKVTEKIREDKNKHPKIRNKRK